MTDFFSIYCHAKQLPEIGDITSGIAIALSIMFISDSDLPCLTVQVDQVCSGASEISHAQA